MEDAAAKSGGGKRYRRGILELTEASIVRAFKLSDLSK
jgi:hypothetical protein